MQHITVLNLSVHSLFEKIGMNRLKGYLKAILLHLFFVKRELKLSLSTSLEHGMINDGTCR